MTVATYPEAKGVLEDSCNQTVDEREPVFIRREAGEDVVLLPAEEYESLSETAYLLASPANPERLLDALVAARRGTTLAMTVEELRAAVGLCE